MIDWDSLTQAQFDDICNEAMQKLDFESKADMVRYAVCHIVDSLREEEKMNSQPFTPGESVSYDDVKKKFPEAFAAVPECYIIDKEVEFYLDYNEHLCAQTPFGGSVWDSNACKWFDTE